MGDISDDLVLEASGSVKKMQRIRISKVIALAAAVLALFGISVFAASVIVSSRSGHSSNIPDYYSVPTRQTLRRDIGIQLDVIDTFSNGYRFKSGHIMHNQDTDKDGHILEQYKGLNCIYAHDGDDVYLYVDASVSGNQLDDVETAEVYKDCELKYYAYANKIVPGDYVLTEQDKRDKEEGKYVFSYGSDSIELHEAQGLVWECGRLNYSFGVIDNGITKDELIQMAKEVIDHQNERKD